VKYGGRSDAVQMIRNDAFAMFHANLPLQAERDLSMLQNEIFYITINNQSQLIELTGNWKHMEVFHVNHFTNI
jgi:hypothetical protein